LESAADRQDSASGATESTRAGRKNGAAARPGTPTRIGNTPAFEGLA
jgi:hypothetical protein